MVGIVVGEILNWLIKESNLKDSIINVRMICRSWVVKLNDLILLVGILFVWKENFMFENDLRINVKYFYCLSCYVNYFRIFWIYLFFKIDNIIVKLLILLIFYVIN